MTELQDTLMTREESLVLVNRKVRLIMSCSECDRSLVAGVKVACVDSREVCLDCIRRIVELRMETGKNIRMRLR